MKVEVPLALKLSKVRKSEQASPFKARYIGDFRDSFLYKIIINWVTVSGFLLGKAIDELSWGDVSMACKIPKGSNAGFNYGIPILDSVAVQGPSALYGRFEHASDAGLDGQRIESYLIQSPVIKSAARKVASKKKSAYKHRWIECVDDRIDLGSQTEESINLPGTMFHYTLNQIGKINDEFSPDGIKPHEECALIGGIVGKKSRKVNVSPDDYAKLWGENVAHYLDVGYRYRSKKEMAYGKHKVAVVVVNGEPRFYPYRDPLFRRETIRLDAYAVPEVLLDSEIMFCGGIAAKHKAPENGNVIPVIVFAGKDSYYSLDELADRAEALAEISPLFQVVEIDLDKKIRRAS